MSIGRHSVTYQGYPCKRVEYRRSEGLEPEYGWVEIDYRHFKELVLEARIVPWRAVNGAEYPGPISIEAWGKIQGSTTTIPAENRPKGKGFAMFGDLVLRSTTDGHTQDPITYRDVFVGDSCEELNERIARAREHKHGSVRVGLSDIRRLYSDHGCILSSINLRLPGGGWDPTTINGSKPWTLFEVLRYLVSQLPGSPIIDSGSELFDLALDPPCDIVGEGETVKEVLEKVLNQYGLVAHMLPDGNYAVHRRVSARLPYGKIPRAVKAYDDASQIVSEKKTVWPTYRPSFVLVVGRRRSNRRFVAYTEVLQNPSDGRYYRLQDVARVFDGYSLDLLDRQVLINLDKSFRNVPPPRRNKLHHQRAKALRSDAYRVYAPAAFFETAGALGDRPVPSFKEAELERVEWLPIQDVPIYLNELKAYNLTQSESFTVGQGDLGPFVLHPPVVWANTRGYGLFMDFQEVKDVYDGLIQASKDEVLRLESAKARIQAEATGSFVRRANDGIAGNYKSGRAGLYGVGSIGIDVATAAAKIITLGGVVTPAEQAAILQTDQAVAAGIRSRRVAKDLQALNDNIAKARQKQTKWQVA